MVPKIVVAGGSGFIGRPLCGALYDNGRRDVWVLSRQPWMEVPYAHVVTWDGLGPGPWQSCLEGAAAVVNLCGATLTEGRWTPERRQLLYDSRLCSTRALADAIAAAADPPKVFISASSVSYYGARGDEPLAEDASPGEGFLARLCVDWEAEARRVPRGVRAVQLRAGIVLGQGGGALRRILMPYRFGLGGPVGSGRQYLSWISRDDLIGLIIHLLDSDVCGPVNATSPEPVANADFSRVVGKLLGPAAKIRLPGSLTERALGDLKVLLMEGQRALPAKAQRAGYAFKSSDLGRAIEACLF
jgi:uncharacterized protein